METRFAQLLLNSNIRSNKMHRCFVLPDTDEVMSGQVPALDCLDPDVNRAEGAAHFHHIDELFRAGEVHDNLLIGGVRYRFIEAEFGGVAIDPGQKCCWYEIARYRHSLGRVFLLFV